MHAIMRRWITGGAIPALLVGLARLAAGEESPPEPKPANPAEIARLDAKMKDVSESFVRETTLLITSYERLGEYARARVLLEALRKLNPDNEAVRTKLAALERQELDAEEFAVDLDPGKTWTGVGMVRKNRPLRIRVTGEYRFTAAGLAGANGMPAKDPATDLVPGVALGAVMGVIVDPAAAGRPDAKLPQPFAVGSAWEKPAAADGILYLKVNLPADAKCTGRLEAKVGGATKP